MLKGIWVFDRTLEHLSRALLLLLGNPQADDVTLERRRRRKNATFVISRRPSYRVARSGTKPMVHFQEVSVEFRFWSGVDLFVEQVAIAEI
jgi:hypothetical protein